MKHPQKKPEQAEIHNIRSLEGHARACSSGCLWERRGKTGDVELKERILLLFEIFMLLVDTYKGKLLGWLKFSFMKISFLRSVAEAVWLSAVALGPRSRWLFICRQSSPRQPVVHLVLFIVCP